MMLDRLSSPPEYKIDFPQTLSQDSVEAHGADRLMIRGKKVKDLAQIVFRKDNLAIHFS